MHRFNGLLHPLRGHTRFLLLLAGAILLVFLYKISLQMPGKSFASAWFKRFANLDGEANLPAWYTSALWITGAWYCRRAGLVARQVTGAFREIPYWSAISLGCLILSLDEAASIHEFVGDYLDHQAGGAEGYTPVYRWVWAGAGVAILAFAASIRFLLALPRKTAIGLLAAGTVFLLGALGMETIGSLYAHGTLKSWPLGLNWPRQIAIEEMLEMTGIILFSLVVHLHIRDMTGPNGRTAAGGE